MIPEKAFKYLSNDHKIFIGLIRIAITGEVNLRWVWMKIGEMVTSRFTTTQARVVRKWLSTPNPGFELTRVMRYLVYVWGEVFVTVKHHNLFVEAPVALLLEVRLTSKYCSYPERTLLATSMSTNGQMCHPESVLPSMLASSKEEERRKAVNIIFSIREQGPRVWDTNSGVRPFKVVLFCFSLFNVCSSERGSQGEHECHQLGNTKPEAPDQCSHRAPDHSLPHRPGAAGLLADSLGAGPASYLCGC